MRKYDLILAGAVLMTAGVLLFLQKSGEDGPAEVVVYQGRERIASFPLEEERTEEFLSPEGGRNVLVIAEGRARIQEADCPDGLCIRQGWISRDGQTLTCLPNQLQVIIEGGEQQNLDEITG